MSNIPSDNTKLVFKEQWWCVSTFSILTGDTLKQKVEQLDKYAEEKLGAWQINDISPKFVPNEEDRKAIIKIANNVSVDTQWRDYINDFDLEEKGVLYKTLGFILFRIRVKKGAENVVKLTEIRPNHMQQIIFRVWGSLSKDFKEFFKFDDATPPYIFSVCVGYNPEKPYIAWNPETQQKYKKELGQWIELYSGQFPDYRDDLYNRRIEGDISNRTSEMHFFTRNSSLLYMDSENYLGVFYKDDDMPKSNNYMFDNVILPAIRIRTIAFAMLIVSAQIDQDTKNLLNKEFTERNPSLIKADLEKSSRLKIILSTMLAPFFTDMARSNRQHYTAVLKKAVDLFDINNSWALISTKIESNVANLNSIFLDKQQDAADRSEKLLNTVNFILGAGVLFEVISILTSEDLSVGAILSKIIAIGVVAFLIVLMIRLKAAKKAE